MIHPLNCSDWQTELDAGIPQTVFSEDPFVIAVLPITNTALLMALQEFSTAKSLQLQTFPLGLPRPRACTTSTLSPLFRVLRTATHNAHYVIL